MRYMRLAVFSILLAGCQSVQSSRNAANDAYAVDSYEQSLAAYQLCAAQHKTDPEACSALSRVMEADKKRYEKVSEGR